MNLSKLFEKYGAVVFFDTETTGLEAESNQIIELAALRIEQNAEGGLDMTEYTDLFVKLPEGEVIPNAIVNLTGITDDMLEAEGVTEAEAAGIFEYIIRDDKGPVLLVAHNAQFDLLFVGEMLKRHPRYVPADDGKNMTVSYENVKKLAAADYLDSLTVYKDRRKYPHKLVNAIQTYKLEDKVQNSHRAIDDVKALFEVCKAMDNERADLHTYVNIFSYNPKYGVSGRRIKGVTYWPQYFNKFMQPSDFTLAAKVQRRTKI